ncbi:Plant UBX domain-containing protein 7 [Linum grandiflorum]
MEGMLSATEKDSMVSSFLEIAVGQTADTARQFLQATSWKLDEALQLFYVGNEGQAAPASHSPPRGDLWPTETPGLLNDYRNETVGEAVVDEVRPPLPVMRDTLYDDAMLHGASRVVQPRESSSLIAFRNFQEETMHPGVWESEQGSASANNPRDLASLYRPPFHLMFQGSFEKAKAAASVQDKWLLINLQSTKEFSSHMLNRDTWANEAVSQTISTNFIFWQVYDDTSEGQKVCTYYRLDSIPVVLVIDPITGQKMRLWCGMVQPESLLEDLVPYMDGGPRDHHKNLSNKRPRGGSLTSLKNKDEPKEEVQEVVGAVSAPSETMIDSSVAVPDNKSASETKKDKETSPSMKTQYPPLPEEPKGDRSILCKVGLRFPDGRRVQRNFLKTDPVQLLWSFCCSEVKEAETRPFRLTQAIPGAKTLDSGSSITFGESGLENSMILLAWE